MLICGAVPALAAVAVAGAARRGIIRGTIRGQ